MDPRKQYELEKLQKIYTEGSRSPIMINHFKYPFSGGAARIAYDDISDFKYIVRHHKNWQFGEPDHFWSEEAEIIAQYSCIEDLINDDWRVD